MDLEHTTSLAANGFHGWRVLLKHLTAKGLFTEDEARAIVVEVLKAEDRHMSEEGGSK